MLTQEIHETPAIEFLLELYKLVAQDEEQGCKVRGPGPPDHLDRKDCIEPPPVGS